MDEPIQPNLPCDPVKSISNTGKRDICSLLPGHNHAVVLTSLGKDLLSLCSLAQPGPLTMWSVAQVHGESVLGTAKAMFYFSTLFTGITPSVFIPSEPVVSNMPIHILLVTACMSCHMKRAAQTCYASHPCAPVSRPCHCSCLFFCFATIYRSAIYQVGLESWHRNVLAWYPAALWLSNAGPVLCLKRRSKVRHKTVG